MKQTASQLTNESAAVGGDVMVSSLRPGLNDSREHGEDNEQHTAVDYLRTVAQFSLGEKTFAVNVSFA